VLLLGDLKVAAACVSSCCLPLTKPLTSTDNSRSVGGATAADQQHLNHRRTLLLNITLTSSSSCSGGSAGGASGSSNAAESPGFSGIGEAAPLPGLHAESYDQALQQLQMLAQLLQGLPVPRTLALLSTSSFTRWLRGVVGLNPDALYPSVRCALEALSCRPWQQRRDAA